jgi:hypothetical protein
MVLFFIDQSQEKVGPPSPRQLLRKGITTVIHKAASAAAELARHSYSGPSASSNDVNNKDGSRGGGETILPLKCSLMSISLPWDTIAHDLLFKVSLSSFVFQKSIWCLSIQLD